MLSARTSLIWSVSKLLRLFLVWWTYIQALYGSSVNHSVIMNICTSLIWNMCTSFIWSISKPLRLFFVRQLQYGSILQVVVIECILLWTHKRTYQWSVLCAFCEYNVHTTDLLVLGSHRITPIIVYNGFKYCYNSYLQ